MPHLPALSLCLLPSPESPASSPDSAEPQTRAEGSKHTLSFQGAMLQLHCPSVPVTGQPGSLALQEWRACVCVICLCGVVTYCLSDTEQLSQNLHDSRCDGRTGQSHVTVGQGLQAASRSWKAAGTGFHREERSSAAMLMPAAQAPFGTSDTHSSFTMRGRCLQPPSWGHSFKQR